MKVRKELSLTNGLDLNAIFDAFTKASHSLLLPPAIDFPQPQRKKTIDVGETVTVYEEKFPSGMVGFLRELAAEWDDNGKTWIYLDGNLWLNDIIDFPIGSVDDPIIFDPPYLVRNGIKIDIYNGTTTSSEFRVYVGGLLFYDKPRADTFTGEPTPEPTPEETQDAILSVTQAQDTAKAAVENFLISPDQLTTILEEVPSDLPPSPLSINEIKKKISEAETIYNVG